MNDLHSCSSLGDWIWFYTCLNLSQFSFLYSTLVVFTLSLDCKAADHILPRSSMSSSAPHPKTRGN